MMDAILHHTVKKGDVLGVARVAELWSETDFFVDSMCHVLPISKCSVDLKLKKKSYD